MVSRTSRLQRTIALLALVAASASTASAQVHFTSCARNTGNNASLFVSTAINPSINGRFLRNGDEIAVFTPQGLCAGVKVWDGTNTAVTVWGDDSITPAKDGMAAGDSLILHVWDSATDVDFFPLNADIDAIYDSKAPFRAFPTYQSDALYSLTRLLIAEKDENRPPIASFTATPVSSVDPYRMAFDASASVDIDGTVRNYLWNFGDASTASGSTVTHTYASAGSYTVSLSVSDDDGAVGAATTLLNISDPAPPQNVPPSASFTVSPASDGNGLKVNLDAASSADTDGSIASYAWTFGDGTNGTGRTTSHTYSAGGTYTIRLTVRDNDGATGQSSATITLADPTTPVNQKPVASFTAVPTGAANGMEYAFDASGSVDSDGSIVSYSWTFGDGTSGTGTTVRHSFAAAGTFTVRLTVRDNQSATGTASANITVTAPPPPENQLPSASFTASQMSGSEYTVRFDGSPSYDRDGTIASFAWSFGDGSSGSGASTTHTYPGAGSYQVTLTVTDNSGGKATSTATMELTAPDPPANEAPLASFTAAPGAADLEIMFDASSSRDPDGSIASYAWRFGDGTIGSGRNPRHTYAAAGTYSVSLTVTDNSGSVGAATASVTVTAPDPPPSFSPLASFTATPAPDLGPRAMRFDGSSSSDPDGSITQYAWTFGDGSTATGSAVSHSYASAGTYTVKLTVRDSDGNTGSASVSVTVTDPAPPANQPPAASFAASPISGGDPYSMRFDASASLDPDGSIASYSWSFGDGTTGTGSVVSHTYTGPGSYAVTLTVRDNLGATGRVSVTVQLTQPDPPANQAPSASFVATPGQSDLQVVFDASGSSDADGNIVSYAWDFGDGTRGNGSNVSHAYAAAGSYVVKLTVTDNDGSVSTGSATVSVTVAGGPNSPPAASFTATPGPNDLEIKFNASSSADPDGRIVAFEWDFGDGTSGFGPTAAHAYPAGGSYVVRLAVRDDAGSISTASATVEVVAPASQNLPPAASFTVAPVAGAPDPYTMRFGGQSSYDPDGSIASYSWNYGDGSTGSGQTSDHAYAAPGSYVVTLTVTDGEGATGRATATIQVVEGVAPSNQPPTASFTAYKGDTDRDRLFDAASSSDTDGSIVSYKWTFGDGTIGEGLTVDHNYADGPGDYLVTLTVVDDDGSVGTTSGIIKVRGPKDNSPPHATLAAQSYEPLTVELDGASSYDEDGSISMFEWDFGDGATGQGPSVKYVYEQGGSYTVTMRITDDGGASSIASVNINIRDLVEENMAPTPSFTATQNSAAGDYVMNFDGSPSVDPDGSIVTYLWDFGGGTTRTGNPISYDFRGPGEYSVSLTVTDNKGVFGTSSTSITLVERSVAELPPAASFTAMPSQDGPFSMEFDASSSLDTDGEITGYSWDFGDGTTEQGAKVRHSYPVAGTYTVRLFVTDDRSNTGSATATVTLIDPKKNSVPTASFVVSSLREVSPVAVTLDASGSFDLDGAIGQYLWDFGDGRGGSGRTTSHEYDASGTYVVSLTITDNAGGTSSKADTISVRFELPEFLDLARVGSSQVRRYAEYQGDVLLVESQGSFGTAEEDAFAYVYSPLTADGQVIARVVSMETSEPWAATGVMIRERLSATSRFVAVVMTDEYGASFQQRTAPGAVGTRQTPGVGWLPYWVRLERKNDLITGYTSIDGQRWSVIGQVEMDMATDVYIGVAVASNADTVLTTSSLDQIFIESTEPEPIEIPTEYELSEIYPNPFNPQAQFSLILSQEEEVTIEVFDALGRLVRTLNRGALAPETRHKFVIDASGLTSGLYIMRVTGASFEQVRKAILLK